MISSTQIRHLLSQGEVREATELLGHAYTISGVVQPGAKRGRELGFPTANLEQIEEMLPADGVYAAACTINTQTYPVALSIGPNPTFGDAARKVECHLAGFSGDLYNSRLDIQLLQHIRGLQSFASVEQLTAQIQSDVAASVRIYSSESL
jgi:riboflavin kinase/FMN adenylyltransferase